jgi:hypothetical protein
MGKQVAGQDRIRAGLTSLGSEVRAEGLWQLTLIGKGDLQHFGDRVDGLGVAEP